MSDCFDPALDAYESGFDHGSNYSEGNDYYKIGGGTYNKTTCCKYCGEEELSWNKVEINDSLVWRLTTPEGNVHTCNEYYSK